MIVMVLILVSAMAQMVSADTAQRWYLTGDSKPDDAPIAIDGIDSHTRDALLNKSEGIGTWGGTQVTLLFDNVAWFYADTGAECGLDFGENPWEAHIRTEKIDTVDEIGSNLTVEICKLDKDTGNITVLARNRTALTAAETEHLWNVTCEDNEFTTQDFNTGDWLAVRLSWDCSPDSLLIYYKAESGSDSYITSPSTDPGYPVPELPTIILFSAGLLILAGYAYMGRRNK
jgi:hypothetical protein